MLAHWSWRSSERLRALPAAASRAGLRTSAKPTPRHPLQALVGRGGERVERDLAGIERHRAEGAHGIDQQRPAVAAADRGDRLDRVQDARGGLAMHGRDMADRRVGSQRLIERRRVVRPVLGRLQSDNRAAVAVGDPGHAPAIGAVDQDEQLAAPGHERGQHRFDYEGAAALKRHRDVAALGAGELDQPRPDPRVQRDEVAVTRAPVPQHGLLHGQGRGQWTGREQIGLVRRAGHLRESIG
jgi:hypothetical protein